MASDEPPLRVDPNKWPEADAYFNSRIMLPDSDAPERGVMYSKYEARASSDGERLYVGRAGERGIEYVYRKGSQSIWAYHPVKAEYSKRADDYNSFETAWRAGHIAVLPTEDRKKLDPGNWPEAAVYFKKFAKGRVHENADVGIIYGTDEARVSNDGMRLYIGRAGVAGIEFVYRLGSEEIWAYYPVEADYIFKADDILSFEELWNAGEITV